MYYDGTKILTKMDINGNKPELYIVTTNRTGGKTTWFSRYLVNRYNTGYFEYSAEQFQCRVSEFSAKGGRHFTEFTVNRHNSYGYASIEE